MVLSLALRIILASCFAATGAGLVVDIVKNRQAELKKATPKAWASGFAVGIIANFLDTLGCGSYAPSTFMYKIFNQMDDIDIPGTLNVGDTFPVIFEALVFISSVECDAVFLVAMCVAAAIGSFGFATVVTKWPRNKIRWALGIAMPLLAIIMIIRNIGSIPAETALYEQDVKNLFGVVVHKAGTVKSLGINGYPQFIQTLHNLPAMQVFGKVGEATGFLVTQWQFWVAVLFNVLWGALMDIGFGLYAPCMATCLMLGLNASTCFPVFMGSCALLMPACSIEFLKTHRYDVPHTIGNAIGGCIGVFIAWSIVDSMPLFWLINLVCVVLLYTSYTLISSALKDSNAKAKTKA